MTVRNAICGFYAVLDRDDEQLARALVREARVLQVRIKPRGGWSRSSQIPALTVPQPSWGSDTMDARLLARSSVNGRQVWIVSFVDPRIPAWFTAWIDRATYRTLRLRMTAAGHFMSQRDGAISQAVASPTRSRARPRSASLMTSVSALYT